MVKSSKVAYLSHSNSGPLMRLQSKLLARASVTWRGMENQLQHTHLADRRWLQFFDTQASLIRELSIGQQAPPSVTCERKRRKRGHTQVRSHFLKIWCWEWHDMPSFLYFLGRRVQSWCNVEGDYTVCDYQEAGNFGSHLVGSFLAPCVMSLTL